MIWSEPTNHPEDCYFCQCPTQGFNRKNRKLIQYPEFTKSQRPLRHGPDLPIPPAPWSRQEDLNEDHDSGNETIDSSDLAEYEEGPKASPQLFDQQSLNDLVRDLGLTKEKSQLLDHKLGVDNFEIKGKAVSFLDSA
ncbi:hypothetical protein QAD02_009384 [Eretmocerus hayati]|uniref:Uncharacterized protein n=1 Tax=Eretmocerus hayati TaxID=131215 RepID=A0ACC2NAK1_9HYME|nr:hypothetical protein QAD02_009384 [Eretmocerus hayati]